METITEYAPALYPIYLEHTQNIIDVGLLGKYRNQKTCHYITPFQNMLVDVFLPLILRKKTIKTAKRHFISEWSTAE